MKLMSWHSGIGTPTDAKVHLFRLLLWVKQVSYPVLSDARSYICWCLKQRLSAVIIVPMQGQQNCQHLYSASNCLWVHQLELTLPARQRQESLNLASMISMTRASMPACLQVIIALTDNWVNGVDKFVNWALGPTGQHADFFTNPAVIQLYNNHVKTVLSRVNTINGRTYRSVPIPASG